jgi:hypothetical protein
VIAAMCAHAGTTRGDKTKRVKPKRVKTRRVPATGCMKAGDKRIDALQRFAAQRNQAAFAAAMARRGLRKAKVGISRVVLHRGVQGRINQRGIPYMKLSMTTINGARGLFLGGGTWWSGSAGRPGVPLLVTDGKGNYYFVRKQPRQSRLSDLVVCGCAQRQCPRYGSGCPACGATSQRVWGPFAPTDRFHGYIDVAYPNHVVRTRHAQGQCKVMRRCPAPPPSMRRR